MKKIFAFLVFLSLVNLSAAATMGSKYPKSARAQRDEKVGSILGEDSSNDGGGFSLLGKKKSSDSVIVKGLSVNPYLWQASLDVISFMPVVVSDPSGGLIATDWLEDLDVKGERHKINVIIKSSELKVENIKVTVFKQVLRDNMWRDAKVHDSLAQDIEDKILTKARSLKLAQEH